MKSKKFKSKIYNTIDWVSIFILIFTTLTFFWQFSILNFAVAITVIIVLNLRQSSFKTKLIAIGLSFASLTISFFNKNEKINLFQLFDQWINFSLRQTTIDFIKKEYSRNSADFILLVVFNIKGNLGWQFYNQLNNLSIGHLVVVSGFHFSALYWLIGKIFKKFKNIKIFFIFFLSFILLYFQQLNFSILIASLMQLFNYHKFKINNYLQRLFLSTTIIILFYPFAFKSISFQLSLLSRVAISIVLLFKIKNNFIASIVMTLIINLLIFPIIGNFNNSFSLWAFVLSFIYSWLFIFNFFVCLFLFPFYWIDPFFATIFNWQIVIFDLFATINVKIPIYGFNFQLIYLYNLSIVTLFKLCWMKKNYLEKIKYHRFQNSLFPHWIS